MQISNSQSPVDSPTRVVTPFLKWAGGKQWLAKNPLNLFPQSFSRYLEPFLGGGTIFFHLNPRRSYLSDLNSDLINAYSAIKTNHIEVVELLKAHQDNHCSDYYYAVRSCREDCPIREAARFIYLNRTCWNGLYRVNLKGRFNVPIGTKTQVLMQKDNFALTANRLKNAKLYSCDFEETIEKAGPNDFVFVDPPYTVKHNLNGFIKYNEDLFSWDDQVRLRGCIDNAVSRGAMVLVLNANHKSIVSLYSGYKKIALYRASVLSGKSEFRGETSELAIKCGY